VAGLEEALSVRHVFARLTDVLSLGDRVERLDLVRDRFHLLDHHDCVGPSGTALPVCTRAASPGAIESASVPTARSTAGDRSDAPNVSSARTAYPSIAARS